MLGLFQHTCLSKIPRNRPKVCGGHLDLCISCSYNSRKTIKVKVCYVHNNLHNGFLAKFATSHLSSFKLFQYNNNKYSEENWKLMHLLITIWGFNYIINLPCEHPWLQLNREKRLKIASFECMNACHNKVAVKNELFHYTKYTWVVRGSLKVKKITF